MAKRSNPEGDVTQVVSKELVAVKKQKTGGDKESALITADLSEIGVKRTSGLSSPSMLLTGHEREVMTTKISPNGKVLASGGYDRKIFLWQVYGNCKNHMVFEGHKGPILHLSWKIDGSQLYSASADAFGAVWDVEEGVRVKKLRGHADPINCISPLRRGSPLVVTASDDQTARVWDLRCRAAVKVLRTSTPTTSALFSDDGSQVFTTGADEDIKVWDFRTDEVVLTLDGHRDMVTDLSLSPDGSYLLSNAMDNQLRVWDVRPFVSGERCVKLFEGHQHNYEKNLLKCSWSPDGSKVTAGSSDGFVYVWDTTSRQIIYKLPGHGGSVNEVCFHPQEPIIASCSSDKKIYLGEFDNE